MTWKEQLKKEIDEKIDLLTNICSVRMTVRKRKVYIKTLKKIFSQLLICGVSSNGNNNTKLHQITYSLYGMPHSVTLLVDRNKPDWGEAGWEAG